MAFSLFQPHLNASQLQHANPYHVIPSRFPAPVLPDVYECNEFYATPDVAKTDDCHIALGLLPDGIPQPFSYHFNDDDPNRLPLTVAHGSCEIVFTTSGEAADDKDPIIVDPTVIRNMAGWVIDQCVKDEGMGGAITKDLKHATDWILDPETAFYEHKMSSETTYLSLHVWNWSPSQDDWNAGDFDPKIGYEIWRYAYKAAMEMPKGADKAETERRTEDLQTWVGGMKYGRHHAWWDGPDNQVLAASNGTGSRGVAASLGAAGKSDSATAKMKRVRRSSRKR